MDYRAIYEEWLSNPYFDEATKAELKAISDDDNEIKERFYKDLEFGTAGLRGIIPVIQSLQTINSGSKSRRSRSPSAPRHSIWLLPHCAPEPHPL